MIYLKRYSLEFILGLCIIAICISISGIYSFKTLVVAREVALQNELLNLRLSLHLYKILNKSSPKELAQLYELGEYFLSIARFDERNRLLDPFGNSYSYNFKNGDIRSMTSKYSNW